MEFSDILVEDVKLVLNTAMKLSRRYLPPFASISAAVRVDICRRFYFIEKIRQGENCPYPRGSRVNFQITAIRTIARCNIRQAVWDVVQEQDLSALTLRLE